MMKKELKINPIRNGTAIDHIPSDKTFDVVRILNLKGINHQVSVATKLESKKRGLKGMIMIGDKFLTQKEVSKITLVAPNATLNIIKEHKVVKKIRLSIPNEIREVVKCSNPNCITNNADVKTRFKIIKKEPLLLKCHYCERIIDEKRAIIR